MYTYICIHINIYIYVYTCIFGRGVDSGCNVVHIQWSACVTCGRCVYVWHDFIPRCGCDSSMCVTRLGSVCVTWLIHMCDMTHAYVRHVSFIRVAHTHARMHTCTHIYTHKLSLTHTHTQDAFNISRGRKVVLSHPVTGAGVSNENAFYIAI